MFRGGETFNTSTKFFDHPVRKGMRYIRNLNFDNFFTWTQNLIEKHFFGTKLHLDHDSYFEFCDQAVKKLQILFKILFVT